MLSRVSNNPQNCQIINIKTISNLHNHEPSCQTVGCILVKRGPIALEIAVAHSNIEQLPFITFIRSNTTLFTDPDVLDGGM